MKENDKISVGGVFLAFLDSELKTNNRIKRE